MLKFLEQAEELERSFAAALAPLGLEPPLTERMVTTFRELSAAANLATANLSIDWPESLAGLTDAEHEVVVGLVRQVATDSARKICEQVMVEVLRSVVHRP